ncbi:dTDP-4-dehydrorhamnose 3,5-epimerase family protein [Nocardia pseudobrasiliensis]|uniref:dTDP-4-dehydrorhamnose 3,5-epimerase n=1 Tax=Nocardia pseudobrasiliensis TaxID=45979 RepID=A0A370HW26_9NOCA|nr:dTDP-4-dehydrorhamnose 3,5-epimerase [Nocardia pseudobrasiliensis]RDI62692.1 dTDP-4-dehydrorhamnose 3,5-epimerase [Nocardia pseudobrasiliensis]
MRIRELAVPGAWEFTPTPHGDERGVFAEMFKASEFEKAVGRPFELLQINSSTSAAGVLRGIHYTEDPPGQAKYVTCTSGAFVDVVVDLRPGSPTFGAWDSVIIDDVDRRWVFLSEGLGHALLALQDDSTVIYLCSLEYRPEFDHEVDAFDPDIGIDWPATDRAGRPLRLLRSPKDAAAPRLRDAAARRGVG